MLPLQTKGNWFNHPVVEALAHVGWGLGVGIRQNEKGKALWQWGENGNYKAFYLAYLASGEFIVYFTNDWRGPYIAPANRRSVYGTTNHLGHSMDKDRLLLPFRHRIRGCLCGQPVRAETQPAGLRQSGGYLFGKPKRRSTIQDFEKDLQAYANILLEKNEKANALEILKLNVTLHTQSSNALAGLAKGDIT